MNRPLAFELILYGLFIAGVSLLVYHKAPDFGRITLVAGTAGGALSILWGVLVLCGYRRRWWMTLALAGTTLALLSQAVTAWMTPARDGDSSSMRVAAVWVTVMFVFSFSLLMNVIHGQGRMYGREGDAKANLANRAGKTSTASASGR